MSAKRTAATAARILTQLRHDRRTVAIMVLIPCLLLGLIAWMFADSPYPVLDTFGPLLLGVFPAIVMFLVTSVATLRERTSGTLERLMTTPISKADFLLGYAIAFAAAAAVQAVVLTAFAIWVCGMEVAGSAWLMMGVAVADAVLGSSLGLAASALARTEFQAVQMMPAVMLPQLAVCGLVMPREQMPQVLEWFSRIVPFSYATDAMQDISTAAPVVEVWMNIGIIAGFVALSLTAGVITLRRRTA
ncbi:MAG: ABC transporter permease [Bifidobacteriaceae bacterium]|jgi:ABC-2 type transport system permease protein|nr:ABC transporter permease [Bifidobacteriaceae bacterium]